MDLDKASLSLQEKFFKRVFGINTNTRYESMSIEELFKYAGSVGEEVEIPNSYDQLLKMYEEEGMLKPVRWRVCTGSLGSPHYPKLLVPSIEDDYEGPLVVKCLCLNGPKLKRSCRVCGEKCSICQTLRKDILPSNYISVIGELEQLCKNKTQCHEFLEHWRHRNEWRSIESDNHPSEISKFWDGSKFRMNQAFWDHDRQWELPLRCANVDCAQVYRVFPLCL